ncbi:hypothetical protein BDW42DRAFT_21476 [Aspergillus taichungensis]|uniref:Uncharacterized protein n=1 Tax=Aspergillus taichungensis TaxID=482145 RepID=A0A2J5HHC2_9EURO|nr:hypothetical protein BDW42DRAFT_21476 [Aspergillus taichungensis]
MLCNHARGCAPSLALFNIAVDPSCANGDEGKSFFHEAGVFETHGVDKDHCISLALHSPQELAPLCRGYWIMTQIEHQIQNKHNRPKERCIEREIKTPGYHRLPPIP